MNIKRILLGENEKKQILSLYGTNSFLNEGYNEATKKYTTEGALTMYGDRYNSELGTTAKKAFELKFPKGSVASKTEYYQGGETKPMVTLNGGTEVDTGKSASVDLFCNENSFRYYVKAVNRTYPLYGEGTSELATKLKKLFCSTESKSIDGGGGKEPPKQFTEKQKCKLPRDTKYIYAKDSSGWWTSKDGGKTWIKLTLPKYKKAVDILNSECRIGSGLSKDFPEDRICRLDGDTKYIYAKDDDGNWWTSRDGGKTWKKLTLEKFKDAVDILEKSCPQGKKDCKTKCNAKPLQPGQTGPQVEMWFYGAVGCYQDTGSGGFSSREECEACKCSDKIGEGGSKEDCFDKFGCLEKLIEDKILLRLDDFDTCGCYHGNFELSDYGNCIFYCDGTAWCEIGVAGDGDVFNWSCDQGKIDMDKEKPIQREVPKPKKPIDGGKDDGDQDFPLF